MSANREKFSRMAKIVIEGKERSARERWDRATPGERAAGVREVLDFATFLVRSGAARTLEGNDEPSAFPRFRSRYVPGKPPGE